MTQVPNTDRTEGGPIPNLSPRRLSSGDSEYDQFVEGFRQHFEKRTGHLTDWSRTYSSDLPQHEQEAMISSDPVRFMNELPPYLRIFLIGTLRITLKNGVPVDELSDLLRGYHLQRNQKPASGSPPSLNI